MGASLSYCPPHCYALWVTRIMIFCSYTLLSPSNTPTVLEQEEAESEGVCRHGHDLRGFQTSLHSLGHPANLNTLGSNFCNSGIDQSGFHTEGGPGGCTGIPPPPPPQNLKKLLYYKVEKCCDFEQKCWVVSYSCHQIQSLGSYFFEKFLGDPPRKGLLYTLSVLHVHAMVYYPPKNVSPFQQKKILYEALPIDSILTGAHQACNCACALHRR